MNNVLTQNSNGEQQAFADLVKVGIHWDTEVSSPKTFLKDPIDGKWRAILTPPHRVCQVYCSSIPISYSPHKHVQEVWRPLACAVLNAEFEATIAVAAILSAQRNERVKVFLCPIGAGVFGNEIEWVSIAIKEALTKYQSARIDVHLVHYGRISNLDQYTVLNSFLKPSL